MTRARTGADVQTASGYLINRFLESKTNRRTDRYGGSLEHRYRLLGEVVAAVSEAWEPGRVSVRLSPNGWFTDLGSPVYREIFACAARQLDALGLA